MADGEVPADVASASAKVAVAFTQSWCGDWKVMRRYLRKLADSEVTVYFVEYDRKPYFEEMKTFKETVFRNGRLPYVRYFRDGRLVSESNLVLFKRRFLKRFDG
jgi:hypothetical protein